MPPARHQAAFVDFICPNNQPGKKQRIQKLDTTSSKSHCLVLITQNLGQKKRSTWDPALRKVVTRPTCINKKETSKKKQVVSNSLAHIWILALRKVDLKSSVKRRTNRGPEP